jgi:hypothetical protein
MHGDIKIQQMISIMTIRHMWCLNMRLMGERGVSHDRLWMDSWFYSGFSLHKHATGGTFITITITFYSILACFATVHDEDMSIHNRRVRRYERLDSQEKAKQCSQDSVRW